MSIVKDGTKIWEFVISHREDDKKTRKERSYHPCTWRYQTKENRKEIRTRLKEKISRAVLNKGSLRFFNTYNMPRCEKEETKYEDKSKTRVDFCKQ